MPLTIRRRLVDHVRQWRKTAYAICVAFVVLAGAVVFLSVSSPVSSLELSSDATFLEANHTYRLAEEMTRLYPQRALGSEDAEGATAWLVEKLATLGIPSDLVVTDEFTAPLGDSEVTFRNVSVTLQGTSRETVIVTAPRDTPAIAKVDLLSYASGTAILMDLAQIFAARPHEKTFVFLSTEGAHTGGLAIDSFLRTHGIEDVGAILSLQGLGKEGTKVLKMGITGAQNTTPGWFVQLTGRVLDRSGIGFSVPGILSQAADHALSLARGDQVAGLMQGIPSLTLIDDSAGDPNAVGLSAQGTAVETLLLSLDGGSEIPPDPGTALLLKSGRFLTNQAVRMLAILMLFPSVAAFLIWVISSSVTPRVILKHLRNLLSFAVPLGVVFLLALGLSRFGLIPRYQFQVPTTTGPATEPRLVPTLVLLVVGIAVFVLSRHFLGYLRPREPRATTEMSKLVTGFFGLVIGLVLILSRSPFMLLPALAAAWAWPLATCFAEPVYSGAVWRHRFTSNAPVLMSGLVTPLIFYAYLSVADEVGWTRAWWFLLVQLVSGSYGILVPLGLMFLAASFLTLLSAKRMRVIPIETLDVTDELSLLELPPPRGRRKEQRPTRPPLSPWG